MRQEFEHDGQRYLISSDQYQFIFSKFAGVDDKRGDQWKHIGYYPSLEGLIAEVSRRALRVAEGDLQSALAQAQGFHESLRQALVDNVPKLYRTHGAPEAE